MKIRRGAPRRKRRDVRPRAPAKWGRLPRGSSVRFADHARATPFLSTRSPAPRRPRCPCKLGSASGASVRLGAFLNFRRPHLPQDSRAVFLRGFLACDNAITDRVGKRHRNALFRALNRPLIRKRFDNVLIGNVKRCHNSIPFQFEFKTWALLKFPPEAPQPNSGAESVAGAVCCLRSAPELFRAPSRGRPRTRPAVQPGQRPRFPGRNSQARRL